MRGVRPRYCGGHPGGLTGCLRRCGGHPGDTSVAPTLRGARPRYCGRPSGRAHGLSAALRRSSGRHKCRPYAAGCSLAILRQANRAGARAVCGIARGVPAVLPVNRDVAAGHPGGRTGRMRHCGRSSGRTHGAECGVAAVIRATQVSPLRCGVLVRDIAASRGCQRSTISTTGTVLTKSRCVT